MLLILVKFVVAEGFVFFVVAIGAFILSHLGLMLVARIDAFISPSERPRVANSVISGGGKSVTENNIALRAE